MADETQPAATDGASNYAKEAIADDRARRALNVAEAKKFAERSDALMLKWHLSLAVGNGAGAVGLTSAILRGWPKGEALLFPLVGGLWCFAIGVFAASVIPLLSALKLDADRDIQLLFAHEVHHGYHSYVEVSEGEMEDSDTLRWKYSRVGAFRRKAVVASQFVGAIAFIVGVLFPLIWITGHLC